MIVPKECSNGCRPQLPRCPVSKKAIPKKVVPVDKIFAVLIGFFFWKTASDLVFSRIYWTNGSSLSSKCITDLRHQAVWQCKYRSSTPLNDLSSASCTAYWSCSCCSDILEERSAASCHDQAITRLCSTGMFVIASLTGMAVDLNTL